MVSHFSMPTASGTQSIDRAAKLLVAVADSVDPIGVRELAAATDLPESPVSRLVARDRPPLAPELEAVRARGYATAIGELEPGLAAMAAPVLAGAGEVQAALSISGPEHRLTRERIAELAPVLMQEAATVSARLGYGT